MKSNQLDDSLKILIEEIISGSNEYIKAAKVKMDKQGIDCDNFRKEIKERMELGSRLTNHEIKL